MSTNSWTGFNSFKKIFYQLLINALLFVSFALCFTHVPPPLFFFFFNQPLGFVDFLIFITDMTFVDRFNVGSLGIGPRGVCCQVASLVSSFLEGDFDSLCKEGDGQSLGLAV